MSDSKHIQHLHTQAEFDRFLRDLDAEADRSTVLSASCMVEIQIERCMKAWLSHGPSGTTQRLLRSDGPLGSFSARIDLLACLGGIDDFEANALHMVRKLRNTFAHELMADFSDQGVQSRCVELAKHVLSELEPSVLAKLIEQGPRQCFVASLFVLVDMLGLRPVLISEMSGAIKYDFAGMSREVQVLVERTDKPRSPSA